MKQEPAWPHDWKAVGQNIVTCGRCGVTALANYDFTVLRAVTPGPLTVGQDVPADCGRLVLQAVHES